MVIDPGTEKGGRADARLRDELVVWLITVSPDGSPVPTPVWFWWDGEAALVYRSVTSRSSVTSRRTHGSPWRCGPTSSATRSPSLAGEAVVDPSLPSAAEHPGYRESTRTSSRA